jgi:hypothetical protein
MKVGRHRDADRPRHVADDWRTGGTGGTTIDAQGIFGSKAGPPTIDPVNITPFVTGSNPP